MPKTESDMPDMTSEEENATPAAKVTEHRTAAEMRADFEDRIESDSHAVERLFNEAASALERTEGPVVEVRDALPFTDWEAMARDLWQILDDVDTLIDVFKPEMTGYVKSVDKHVRRRNEYMHSADGYNLLVTRQRNSSEGGG